MICFMDIYTGCVFVGGRKMHIIRTLEDDNMLVTKYEQTNLKDNAKTGYIQYTTRVIG